MGGWKWFPVIPRHYGVIGEETVQKICKFSDFVIFLPN